MDADVAVIGAGPAGIQATIHAARKKVSVVLAGRMEESACYGIKVENLFGLPGVSSGTELLMNGNHQIREFGVEPAEMDVLSARPEDGGFAIVLESDETVYVKAVVLATGMRRNILGVPGEKELAGRGVSYCAVCDCNFYKGKRVVVAGSGSEAAVSAELMTKYASEVYWVSPGIRADQSLVRRAVQAGAEVVMASVAAVKGEKRVASVMLSDGREIDAEGLFVELGGRSSADLAMDLGVDLQIDDTVKVGRDCSTGVAGVFACGDITGRPWQIAKAVGEGAVAGLSAAEYVGRSQ